MQRRGLLKAIAGLLLGAPVLSANANASVPLRASPKALITILDTRIAGFAHYQGEACLPFIKQNDELELRRQANNPKDHRAIEVFWRSKKIGYVPRINNRALSRLMDQGYTVRAQVKRIDDGLLWEPLFFEVSLNL